MLNGGYGMNNSHYIGLEYHFYSTLFRLLLVDMGLNWF